MVQEAQVVVSAAILTTSWAAAIASFHIINNYDIFKKLRAELVEAIPDPFTQLDWQFQDRLPVMASRYTLHTPAGRYADESEVSL